MKTVWKYELQPEMNEIEMPEHAHILTALWQQNGIHLWALVRTEKTEPPWHKEKHYIYVTGTGHPIPEDITKEDERNMKWINTVKAPGEFMFHIFEVLK